ncbi:PREDICTED: DDB1- and CUL4-associated factor 10 isoform X1 [Cercocebus atys]|uniref:DDB1- and CUL4-associated factor 10 isoform X1 n=1 Tax=Cercocebus atys TaxID=9531 RepID=UPI0005F4C260|nr:PREDICTED: DDB1- and CUL4-associated factor 10 isoform X1 [Cercocebus atys]
MFPFGPHSPGGDGSAGAGAEEPAPHEGQAAATRPPSPLHPGADETHPPPPARSPRRPGAPSLSPAPRSGELGLPGAPESSAASAQGEPSPPSPPRRRPGPDCKAESRGRHGLCAGLGGPGARLFGWLKERSLGRGLFVDPARDNFRTMTSLYGSIHPADSVYLSTRTHGAVFNLEYSPDGSVLTVACEQTEVLLFDPISSKHIKTLSEAHEDCVNNIRFLDNRLFATCSDDTTIALWDLRKLNTKVCTLHGHTSWVKNIEYDTNTRLLVTSGFDGNVIIWDTNRYTEDGCPHKKFFHTRFLMRMRLTPDCSKMLISTSSGYLLILHDLDLTKSLEVGSYPILRARRTTSSSDLTTSSSSSGPRVSGSPCHHSDSNSSEKHMSRASQREGVSPRNSLEVVTPEVLGESDHGNCITSLQLHPKGWATLLRCSSNSDDEEVQAAALHLQQGSLDKLPLPCVQTLGRSLTAVSAFKGILLEILLLDSPVSVLSCFIWYHYPFQTLLIPLLLELNKVGRTLKASISSDFAQLLKSCLLHLTPPQKKNKNKNKNPCIINIGLKCFS